MTTKATIATNNKLRVKLEAAEDDVKRLTDHIEYQVRLDEKNKGHIADLRGQVAHYKDQLTLAKQDRDRYRSLNIGLGEELHRAQGWMHAKRGCDHIGRHEIKNQGSQDINLQGLNAMTGGA